jgi:hypothetical protein
VTAPPKCPQDQSFKVLTGFLTPGSDAGPGTLDASISVDVLDPTEGNERVRAVEITDPWALEVDWCICGRFADIVGDCWCVQVFIDDVDGVGPTNGLIGSRRVSVDSAPHGACHDWMRRSGSRPEASWASPGQESDRPALNVTGGLAGVPQIRSAK